MGQLKVGHACLRRGAPRKTPGCHKVFQKRYVHNLVMKWEDARGAGSEGRHLFSAGFDRSGCRLLRLPPPPRNLGHPQVHESSSDAVFCYTNLIRAVLTTRYSNPWVSMKVRQNKWLHVPILEKRNPPQAAKLSQRRTDGVNTIQILVSARTGPRGDTSSPRRLLSACLDSNIHSESERPLRAKGPARPLLFFH